MTIDISLRLKLSQHAPVTPAPQLWRVPHDQEIDDMGRFVLGKRDGKPSRAFPCDPVPETTRAYPSQTIAVGNYPALLDLLCRLNPEFTTERCMDLLGTGMEYCNNKWGTYHDTIIIAGAVLEEDHVEGHKVFFKSILISDPAPSLDKVLHGHLSSKSVSVHMDGRINYTTRPNGHDKDRSTFRMLIVRQKPEPLWYYDWQLHKLPPGVDPDALYLP